VPELADAGKETAGSVKLRHVLPSELLLNVYRDSTALCECLIR
jgi:hypothetical protein